jgi:hypothetical protein
VASSSTAATGYRFNHYGKRCRALGREVRYQAIPPDEFEAGLRDAIGEAAAPDIAAVYRWMAENEDSRLFISDPGEIRERFQAEPMDLEQWASRREWAGPAIG